MLAQQALTVDRIDLGADVDGIDCAEAGSQAGGNMSQRDEFHSIDDQSDGLFRELGTGLTTRIFSGDQAMLSIVSFEPNSEGVLQHHPEEQWGSCWRAPPSGCRAGRRSRSGRATSGVRRGMFRTRCEPAQTAHGSSTSSARRVLSTASPARVLEPHRSIYERDRALGYP